MKIASRYRPFSHKPGVSTLVPGTDCEMRAYPAALYIKNQQGEEVQIEWALTGLIQEFTVMQDLEKKRVVVYGRAKEGYFNYALFTDGTSLKLKLERASAGCLKGTLKPLGIEVTLKPKEQIAFFAAQPTVLEQSLERISFGNHKTQEWESVRQRKNPLEYFPFLFAAGQLTAVQRSLDQSIVENVGTLAYVKECQSLLEHGEKELFLEKFQELFEVGFEELMLPRLYDSDYLGIGALRSTSLDVPRPLQLLKESYYLIRAMLLQESAETVSVLPYLPAIFHAGRCLNLRLEHASCDIEWSKKILKKLIVTSFKSQKLHFNFQKSLTSFRLRNSRHEKGKEYCCGEPLDLGEGIYILDQFKK